MAITSPLSTTSLSSAPSYCLLLPDTGALALELAAELGEAELVGVEEAGEADEVLGSSEAVELIELDKLGVRIAVVVVGISSEVKLEAMTRLPLPDREGDDGAVGKEMVRVVVSTIVGNVSRLSTVLAV